MTINYTTGYAGTGKSTKLIEMSKGLDPETSVILCPTHKAIKRLYEGISKVNPEIEIKTIHSLLGWIPTINENATHIAHIDSTRKLDKELDDYKTIVIDEAGMMSEDMFLEIVAKIEAYHNYDEELLSDITLELFLDPYQLLPVKGKQIQIDPLTTTNLTTQHRSDSPDLVSLYTKFVHYLEGVNTKDLKITPSDNVHFIDTIPYFNPQTDRLLAYTNNCVGYYNKEIAKLLGISSYLNQEVQLGNMLDLVTVDSYIEPSLEELIDAYYYNPLKNDYKYKLLLQNSQISKKFIEYSLQSLINHSSIKFILSGNTIIPVIEGIDNANIILSGAKEAALQDKKMFKHVYTLGRAFIMDYPFASTVHKAQGSEFDKVFIVQKDIQKAIMNGYYDNYARMMYVALSRAKKKVFII